MTIFHIFIVLISLLSGCDRNPDLEDKDSSVKGDLQPVEVAVDSEENLGEESIEEEASEALEPAETDEGSEEEVVVEDEPAEIVVPVFPCSVTEVQVTLSRMEDIVSLINQLPKPLSLSCFIQHLPRPLPLMATLSTLSIQPSFDDKTPRLFIFYGDLILSLVPEGEESDFLEISHVLNDQTSVKGEIHFPVLADMLPESPYLNIQSNDLPGSRCQGCHGAEVVAPLSFPEGSIQSKTIRPMTQMDMSLTFLRYYAEKCEDLLLERCQVLQSLFYGDVEPASFPQGMPTFF